MSSQQRINRFRQRTLTRSIAGLALALLFAMSAVVGQSQPPKVTSLRLYIFDHGYIRLTPDGVRRIFGPPFDPDKLSHSRDQVVPFHLIVHPKGTLVWESGVPDSLMTMPPENDPASGLAWEAPPKSLPDQLATIGYKPADITYHAFSHYHQDHSGNSDMFVRSTWLVRKAERDAIFGGKPVGDVSQLKALKNAKTVVIETDEYDVFGDGTVVLMKAHGHTPGQQVLRLKLAKTGPVMLAGDLYHFIEERPPTNWFSSQVEADPKQSRESRARIEEYVRKTGTQLWINHDADAYANRKKAPEYYD